MSDETATPTDPATPPADPATPPATDPATPPADPATPEGETEDARITRANRQAAQYRTELRTAQEALAEQGKTLAALAAVFNPGATPGDQPDPAALTGQVEQLTTRAAQLEAELLVHNLAGTNGANPTALLDSRTFTTALHGLDATAADYHDQVAAAIKDAVSKNATLATAGQGPSRGGAPGAGAGAEQPAGSVTQEQFDAMDFAARTALFTTNPDLYRRLAGTAT